MIFILAIIFALARAAHGGGHVSRLLSILIMSLGFVLVHISTYGLCNAAIAGLIAFAGLFLGLVLGWGAYFSSFSGSIAATQEKEFPLADKFARIFEPKVETPADARRYGVAGMCARFGLFLPMYIGVAWYVGDWFILAKGCVAIVTSGFLYGSLRYFPNAVEKYGSRYAEVATFLAIGGALA